MSHKAVLGPLLFLLYINDIVLSSSVCKFTLFADDTSLFYSHKDKIEGAKILNTELSKIADWLAANKLSLNVSKSKLLIFSNKHTLKEDDTVSDSGIYINGEMLNEVDHAKYLGTLPTPEIRKSALLGVFPSNLTPCGGITPNLFAIGGNTLKDFELKRLPVSMDLSTEDMLQKTPNG